MASAYEYVSTIICDDCRREDNGKDIAIGIYAGSIASVGVPVFLPTFAFRFEIVPKKLRYENVTVIVKDRDDVEVLRVGGTIAFADANHSLAFFFKSASIFFPKEGQYTVFLAMDDEPKEVYKFEVQKIGLPPTEQSH